jgi:Mg-chelatase subunit ChlD
MRSPKFLPQTALLIALVATTSASTQAAPTNPIPAQDQGCSIIAARRYELGDQDPLWGDEVEVQLQVALDCDPALPERLSITESLPEGVTLVPGLGEAPDERQGRVLRWNIDRPPNAPPFITRRYRIYLTPDRQDYDAAGELRLGWPMFVEVSADGENTRLPLPDLAPLVLRKRLSGGSCGMSRERSVEPTDVLAGEAFTVSLRLSLNLCSAHAQRSRVLVAWPPPRDSREGAETLSAMSGLVDRLRPDGAQVGALFNLASGAAPGGAAALTGPTTAYAGLTGAIQSQALGLAAGDAASGLDSGLAALPDWPLHHELLLYIGRSDQPRADPAALANRLDALRAGGIELVTLCLGGGCDPGLSWDYALDNASLLRAWMRQDALDRHRGPALRVDAVEVEEQLPRYLELDPQGVAPPAERFGGSGLRWRLPDPIPGRVYSLQYRAQVHIWGRLPLGIGGRAQLIQAGEVAQTFEVPEGEIQVARGPGEPGPCRPQVAKSALPARLPMGDPVEISLEFGAECPDQLRLVDVMLVLDHSGSMNAEKLEAARKAAGDFLDILPAGEAQSGLVLFSSDVSRRLPLTANFEPLRAALASMQAVGGTNIEAGIRAATEELRARRESVNAAMIVMTDGFNNRGGLPVLEAAAAAKAEGILVITVCFGPACDLSLEAAASSPAHAYHAADGDALRQRFSDLALILRQIGLASASIRDQLPEHIRYVPGSAQPPADWDPVARVLSWQFASPPSGGLRLRYQAEPLLLGQQATNLLATVDFVDERGRPGAATFPVPVVETYIPAPEGPCEPRLDKRADPARLNLGQESGITLELSLDCPQRETPLDVVLALDHSASMGSLERLVNVKRAAAAFLDRLDPAVVRVGLVGFADDVTVRVPITDDFASLRAAVNGLRAEGTTAISQALNASREMMAGRRPEAGALVILLTDGENTAGPESMLAAAGRLKDDGTEIITICADPGRCDASLPAAASRPDYAFDVGDSALLVDLLDAIAVDLTRDRVHDLLIEDRLSTAVEVDAASIQPPPADFDGRRILWRFDELAPAGLSLRYRARPQVAGQLPVSRFARVDYQLGLGGAGRVYFPLPVLYVVDPDAPTPSPTVSSPTPIATSATPGGPNPETLTPPHPDPTSAVGHRLYLPYLEAAR